jgi:hypothetical protein
MSEPQAAMNTEDADAAVHRLVAEMQGQAEPKPRPKPPARPEPDMEDADAMVHNLADRILEEQRLAIESQRHRKRFRDPRATYRNDDTGRIPVEMLVGGAPKMPNALACEDEDGTSLVKRDPQGRPYRTRWVRVKDDLDQTNENTLRLRQMKAWGYEPVMKKDNTPLRLETLVCMQCPVEADAKRVIYHSKSGAFDKARQVDRLRERADELNSEFSRAHSGGSQGVVSVQPLEGHGEFKGGLNDNY